MKKKIILITVMLALFACLLAISISAATQNYSTFDVVLTDGTQKTFNRCHFRAPFTGLAWLEIMRASVPNS